MDKIKIALVGNPNCGKTTLFNGLTGGNIKTGNWPGVTVEKREGLLKSDGSDITIVDLPGIYSFSAHSEDEKVARDYILSGEPACIINIVDASNLERNLYLTVQLIEMKVPIIIILNMIDIAEKEKIKINVEGLSKKLGLPVLAISAVDKEDITRVKKAINDKIADPIISNINIDYPNEIESVIASWDEKIRIVARKLSIDSRWISLKVLENDAWIKEKVLSGNILAESEVNEEQNKIEKILGDSAEIITADYRFGFISGLCRQIIKKETRRRSLTDKIDRIVLNKVLGIPIFLAVMYLTFWLTISFGGAFIDFFEGFFGTIFVDGFGTLLETIKTPSWLKIILADGIGGGIQAVATFVPIMFMMFFVLSILEDSGYMARAAFVMDRFMKLLGLPGKAFIPMIVGFGCTVPAILGTRTLENKKDRFLTIFMAPFMSCGARLPVYALFVAAFFPKAGGLIVFSIYMTGIILAVLTGILLKNTLFRGERSYFIMELPPYHAPRIKHIFLHTWLRLKSFVIRAGAVIIIAVAILGFLNSIGTDGTIGNEDSENSVLSVIGKTITPVFEPMGIEKDNWPATVGIFTGLFAKEAVVGTLNSLYSQIAASDEETETEEEESFDFWDGIKNSFLTIPEGLKGVLGGLVDPFGLGVISEKNEDEMAEEIGTDKAIFGRMNKYFSKGGCQAYAYLLFVLLYFPCVAAFGAIVKETGWLFGLLNAGYLTLLAWITATLFYQITTGRQPLWIIVSILLISGVIIGLYILKFSNKFTTIKE
ncbi:MAG TPA: Fe(2+) transporter permease subunit FeoB [Spirochaetota bacterium]|jgi:ferrous iron transport protein B|nr:MAG: Ferrous iron transport protein B [Spirochaetes bacterium ADurb.Bin133]HNZ25847.1 Fe(2+) transporter permease subunit FeoB [Spirochaetota bacterium]HPY86356.1 Fe(2+) transporter permease subunit FeoB [Spirochaetota bacterium]